ncbi:MAG TPA: 5'-3' exonuclease H3TH domain-containing protein [Verrucomicrobiae bacterium]|nr:5'-3' exonuclease H3TH domain-containing protein [Verrucomicrobiae bacterium]
MPDTLLLLDAYSLIYRAFYAIRSLTGPDGQPVNAIYGLTKMLRKMAADYQPACWGAVFDLGAPQKRLKILPSYKIQRPPTPPDLDRQLPAIREILTAMRVSIIEKEGEEADDIVATLAVYAAGNGYDVLIASNDKDFMQIVSPQVRLLRPNGKETVICDAGGVQERYGIRPDQVIDFLSLLGDAVDNIPGVPGVGEKTAAQLLQRYGTLENLLAHASEIPKPKLQEALMASGEQIRANRRLIALQTDLPLPVTIEALKIMPPDTVALAELFRRFGFKSLLAELEKPAAPSSGADLDLFGSK